MYRLIIVVGFLLFLNTNAFTQFTREDLPPSAPNVIQEMKESAQNLKGLRDQFLKNLSIPPSPNDLIIGQSDPNEVVTITGSYLQDGDIIILNNGVLNLDSADFHLRGDITILGNGEMNINGGSFVVVQGYSYQFQVLVVENGKFRMDGVNFQSSYKSWGLNAVDSASVVIKNTQITNGFITHGYFGFSTADIENTSIPGEFLCFGYNELSFRKCDQILFWTVLLDSSSINLSFPSDSLLNHWTLNDSLPGISGIPYSVSIDSCTGVKWGLISRTGSQGIFHDTDFFVIGLMFTGPDSIVVQNLVNDSYHTDDLLSLPDRTLHLINTRVGTWNLYPFGNSIVTVENCIFGELIASDSSRTVITNSLCDGSGGYLGVESDAELVVVQSLINSQVLSSDNSILIAAQSAFNTLDVVSTDASIMVLFNTLHLSEPQLFDASTVFEGFLPPIEGDINSEIPLIGTARILTGPLSPFQFVGYSVEWSQEFENPIWHPTDGMHSEVVVNDTLAIWDTHNLNPDTYALKLNLFHNFGDSLGLITWAQLEEPVTGVGSKENTVPETISLDNFPNPFNPTTTIYFTLPQSERVTLEVFNILGEKIATLVSGELTPGIHRVIWNAIGYPSGVYLYRLETEEGVEKIGKMMLLK